MLVRLSQLKHDISWHEEEARKLLSVTDRIDERVQLACGHFDRILGSVFDSLDKSLPWRSWCVDDLWCESYDSNGSVQKLAGIPYWLSGGVDCDQYTLDVDLSLEPMLYSFKFYSIRSQRQSLYVGKYPDGWKLGT